MRQPSPEKYIFLNVVKYVFTKRSWSPQVVRMIPGHGFLMHNFPPSFGLHSLPSSRKTIGSTPKNGLLALPGFKVFTPGNGVIKCPPVSVCHHVSTTGQRSLPIIL